jgi:hypothetical protein
MTNKDASPPPYLKTTLGDPLGRLVDRLALSPVHCAAIALGVALLVGMVSYALAGVEVIERSGWMDLWAYVTYLYVVFPVIIGAYVWVGRAASRLFYGLRHSEALAAAGEAHDRFVLGPLQAHYNHPGWTIASGVLMPLCYLRICPSCSHPISQRCPSSARSMSARGGPSLPGS